MKNKQPSSPYLSKSLYIKGLQCHKALWLLKNRPELKTKPTASQQAAFDSGTDVGVLAQQLFPNGVLIPYDGLSHAEQLAMTKEALNRGETTIYEATFSFDNVFVKVDILHHGANGWEIHEVKSSTECKEVYLNDIAVQQYVVAGSGLPVARSCLIHMNKRYVRRGGIEVNKLFTIQDVTENVASRQAGVPENLAAMRIALGSDMPVTDIGPHCDAPYACDFKGHCWSHIPADSVFSLRDHGKPDPFALYRQGIIHLNDIPMDSLKWRQRLQLEGFLNKTNVIKSSAVSKFLDSLSYPLCFMDFETTYMNPVPLFDGTRPYQQVPFQFSLHVISEPEGPIEHYEFLADGAIDPRQEFLERLLEYISKGACILTWNQVFEKKRLQELAAAFPDKHAEIHAVIGNLCDLMVPFRNKSIYHWKFNGSYSIKAVLTALVPELSYDQLGISNGEMAAAGWLRMILMDDKAERDALRQQLLEYCQLDTLAMVRILGVMREYCRGECIQA